MGLNGQRASPREQCAIYECGLRVRSLLFHSLLAGLRLLTRPPVVPKGCTLLNYTPSNHGKIHGPISYE